MLLQQRLVFVFKHILRLVELLGILNTGVSDINVEVPSCHQQCSSKIVCVRHT